MSRLSTLCWLPPCLGNDSEEPNFFLIMENVQVPIADGVGGNCNFEVSAANNPGDDMLNINSNRHLVFSLRVP